jgi:hypothetical protein
MEVTGTTDAAKAYRAFYPLRRTKGGISVSFVFPNYNSYNSFAKWMESYARRLADHNNQVGPMRVVIPAFGFNITAIPTSGWSFGDQVGTIVYKCTVSFDSAGSASDFQNLELSRFRRPKRGWKDSRYFYPSGTQLSGRRTPDRLGGDSPPISGDDVRTQGFAPNTEPRWGDDRRTEN